jgi:RNA polymerase sigma-B factor
VTTTDRRKKQRVRRAARLRRRREEEGAEVAPEPKVVDQRFGRYRETHDRAIRNELVEEHRWLAQHCARRFARKGEPMEDLVQVATVGVLKAVERFDPSYGVVFTTFAVPTVMGELRRHFRDKTWSVHVPRRAKELYQSVSGVAEELSQALLRSPTVPEIAQRAGTTVEDTLEALEVRASYRGVPLAPPGEEERADGPGFGRQDRGYDAAEARLTVDRLLDTLPDRDRRIVELRFIQGMTQTQIAGEIGVSQVQVSRLLRAALDRMRRPLTRERV